MEAEKPYGVWDFRLYAITPTRPCPVNPKQIRMDDVAYIIWILFIIRISPCPGRDVAILLPRRKDQLPTDRIIIACPFPFVYHPRGIILERAFQTAVRFSVIAMKKSGPHISRADGFLINGSTSSFAWL